MTNATAPAVTSRASTARPRYAASLRLWATATPPEDRGQRKDRQCEERAGRQGACRARAPRRRGRRRCPPGAACPAGTRRRWRLRRGLSGSRRSRRAAMPRPRTTRVVRRAIRCSVHVDAKLAASAGIAATAHQGSSVLQRAPRREDLDQARQQQIQRDERDEEQGPPRRPNAASRPTPPTQRAAKMTPIVARPRTVPISVKSSDQPLAHRDELSAIERSVDGALRARVRTR